MKIKVLKEELRDALSIAAKALSKAVIQVERGHLLFSIDEKKISVMGTNNDLKACVDMDLQENDTTEQFSFTADPKMLERLITKIDQESITLDYDPDELALKVYTSEDEKSFNTMQSFPTTKMLTVDGPTKPLDVEYQISTSVLLRALTFCQNYLEMREENKRYDFVILNKGVAFGSNGLNKMGFFVGAELKPIENMKIRKVAVPLFISVLKKVDTKHVLLGEQGNSLVIQTPDKTLYFGCLKSSVESPKISMDMLKKGGPYTEVPRVELSKKLKRLFSTKNTIAGSGIEMTLNGAGTDASITLALLANLKGKESLACSRMDDTSPDDVKHIVDCKLFQNAVDSFTGDNLNLYINTDSPFFRIYEVIEEEGQKFITVGVGSYSRVVKQ